MMTKGGGGSEMFKNVCTSFMDAPKSKFPIKHNLKGW